jgi:creatinine amidohydrolase
VIEPTHRLVDLRAGDPELDRPVLAVPVGSCEQHGPHLPFGTDTLVAQALADRLAERLDGVVVAPAVTVSASGEHRGFAGTLSIGTDATTTLLVELARSADWAAGLVLVNGHGGNAEAVRRAVAQTRTEGRRMIAWWPRVPGGDGHAGATETALVLALAPHAVASDRMACGNTAPLADLAVDLRRDGVRAVSPNGVLGDPRAATLDDGLALLDRLLADLVAATVAARDGWAIPP